MNKERLFKELKTRLINIDEAKLEKLYELMYSTLETNKKFNLTAIKEEDVFVEKMLFDSAIALQYLDINDKNVIDVGTGAGFPGMVLHILEPKARITLMDSTAKKIKYLMGYCSEHGLTENVDFIADRAESRVIRNEMDYAFARAVAPLNILIELIVPMLKVGGTFVALKSVGYEKEIEDCQRAMKKLGCRLHKVVEDNLPESNELRVMIHIIKEKDTLPKYPRDYATIKKLPL